MNEMYVEAYEMALKVEFLASSEELFLYAGALYSAMTWGKDVDERNKMIRKKAAPAK
nr:MAG TPA: hypothetical protein [Caudoviricetes sp.]